MTRRLAARARAAARRLGRTARGIREEIAGARRVTADTRSFLRWTLDILAYRALLFVPLPPRRRSIRLRSGATVTYRLDRGDIRALAETLVLEVYRLPDVPRDPVIVDLGANIGVASVWLSATYGCGRLVAVEPSAGNAAVVRANMAANGLSGEVIEAAVSRRDGTASFREVAGNSTLGALGAGGRPVRTVSMATVLAEVGADVDVLKLDIEGGEEDLLAGDLAWLDRVGLVIAELHPHLIDVGRAIAALESAGFSCRVLQRHGPDWLFGDVMALFTRPERDPAAAALSAGSAVPGLL
ncbi:MAG TPA: FkbM family methyltransferase [Solirubrobacteraceae bacterium]